MLTNIVTSKHTVSQFFQVQFLLFMELWKYQKRLILTKVYHKSGQNYIINWGISYDQLGQVLLQIGSASFKYKLGQMLLLIGAAFLLQFGESVITNWGSLIITSRGKFYQKSGQLLQIRATAVTNYGSYYKLGQSLLQIGATITNWVNYYKLGNNRIFECWVRLYFHISLNSLKSWKIDIFEFHLLSYFVGLKGQSFKFGMCVGGGANL